MVGIKWNRLKMLKVPKPKIYFLGSKLKKRIFFKYKKYLERERVGKTTINTKNKT